MGRAFSNRIVLVAVVAALSASACGGGDDGGSSDGDSSSNGGGAGSTEALCPTAPFTLEISADADGDAPGFDAPATTITDVFAVELDERSAWTILMADYELDPQVDSGSTPVPEGQTRVIAFVTVFNSDGPPPDLASGDIVPVDSDDGSTFGLLIEQGSDMYNTSTNASGSAELLHVGANEVCIEFDYSDDFKQVSGAIRAPLFTISGDPVDR